MGVFIRVWRGGRGPRITKISITHQSKMDPSGIKPTLCIDCDSGKYNDEVGASVCKDCESGRSSPEKGSVEVRSFIVI